MFKKKKTDNSGSSCWDRYLAMGISVGLDATYPYMNGYVECLLVASVQIWEKWEILPSPQIVHVDGMKKEAEIVLTLRLSLQGRVSEKAVAIYKMNTLEISGDIRFYPS